MRPLTPTTTPWIVAPLGGKTPATRAARPLCGVESWPCDEDDLESLMAVVLAKLGPARHLSLIFLIFTSNFFRVSFAAFSLSFTSG